MSREKDFTPRQREIAKKMGGVLGMFPKRVTFTDEHDAHAFARKVGWGTLSSRTSCDPADRTIFYSVRP